MNSFRALHPDWTKKDSTNLLNNVFFMCYNDTEPFDRIPLTQEAASLSYKAYSARNRYSV